MKVMEKLSKIRMVNKVKIRMKRRKISTRLFQMVIVTVVITLFVYLIFTAGIGQPSPETVTVSLTVEATCSYHSPQIYTKLAASYLH